FAAALSAPEQAVAAAFPMEKRRRDWSLGRLAAKAALLLALEERGDAARADELLVLAGPEGAPVPERLLASGERAPLELGLSLSHGHGLGAAWALASGRPGVDLERIKERPEGTFRFYLDERERAPLAALAGSARDELAVVLWAIKEAAWKTLRPGRGVGLIDL